MIWTVIPAVVACSSGYQIAAPVRVAIVWLLGDLHMLRTHCLLLSIRRLTGSSVCVCVAMLAIVRCHRSAVDERLTTVAVESRRWLTLDAAASAAVVLTIRPSCASPPVAQQVVASTHQHHLTSWQLALRLHTAKQSHAPQVKERSLGENRHCCHPVASVRSLQSRCAHTPHCFKRHCDDRASSITRAMLHR